MPRGPGLSRRDELKECIEVGRPCGEKPVMFVYECRLRGSVEAGDELRPYDG